MIYRYPINIAIVIVHKQNITAIHPQKNVFKGRSKIQSVKDWLLLI